MTIDITKIQRDLSEAGGARVNDRIIADVMNLSPASGAGTVRRWKAGDISGPAITAFGYVAQGLPDAVGAYTVPEFVIGPSPAAEDSLFIVRLRYPRFVGWIEGAMFAPGDRVWHPIEGTELKMTVIQWIDQNFGSHAVAATAIDAACTAIRDELARKQAVK